MRAAKGRGRTPSRGSGADLSLRFLGVTSALLLVGACSAGPPLIAMDRLRARGASERLARTTTPAPTLAPVMLPARLSLGVVREAPLPFTVEPIQGGDSALLVSQFADGRAAWVRRITSKDGKSQALGPVIELVDEHVYTAFDSGDDRFTLVTSDGARLCVATYAREAAAPEARGCAAVTPSAIVPVGDRLALLEVASLRAESHAPSSRKPNPPAAARPRAPAEARHPKKSPPEGRVKPKKREAHPARSHPAGPTKLTLPKVPVEIRVRFAGRAGEIEAEAKPTGLRFEAPLDGMTLVDARPRPPLIDLLWYESVKARKTRAPLGSARLVAGSLRVDGSFDRASRVAVVDADLAYGALHDHHAPRLVGTSAGSAYLGLDARGQCEVTRALPTLARLTPAPALCAIDPDRLAASPPPDPAGLAALDGILATDPQRFPGQPRREPGLVAWAGDRAYFLHDGALRSATRDGLDARDEPSPFPARRARVAWAALAVDGEALALTPDGLARAAAPAPGQPPLIEGRALSTAELSALARAADLPIDRRRAARIGASWWVARGDVTRVFPDALAPPSLRGAAPVDASALVGGASHGVLIEVAGEALLLRAIDAAGEVLPLGGPPVTSPVRVGLDACERAAGGALVAGVSAADPSKVVAFAVDAEGHVGAARETPLPIVSGELAVRMTALPGGGALLTDRERRHVVWLDDDAFPVGDALTPAGVSAAVCVDGRPAPTAVPAPTPGAFVHVTELAVPGTCIVGEPTWTAAGALVWVGSAQRGPDAVAELRVAPLGVKGAPSPPRATFGVAPDPSRGLAAAPVCPSEMVSIDGRFCVDRFEATIFDAKTGELLSPDFPTTPGLLEFALGEWSGARSRTGSVHARALPLPFIAKARFGQKTDPVAVARLGGRPNGYLTGLVAEAACGAAGKRLCSLDEFVTACRGEGDEPFPYGDAYEDGACNVYREEHPAALLHDNASIGHLDPRLNRVPSRGRPLLRAAGETATCRSRWGSDAAYDMNGNLDEWIDEGSGAFAGGFYARATRSGCDALVASHPRSYLDYSTGVRCCKDAAPRW
jgi:hypothetical protein